MLLPVARRVRRVPAVSARDRTPPGPSPRAGALLAVVLVVVGGLWLSGHRTVTFVVDGQVRELETHAGTVAGLLERSGVNVGPDDRVSPGVDAALDDGMVVEVVHAREITLLVGDVQRQVVVAALTVQEALEAVVPHLEAAAAPRSLVRPSRDSRVRPGMVVEFTDPVALTVVHDGRHEPVVTDEATVGDVLAGLGVDVGPDDRVIPGPEHPTEPGITVTVQRVRREVQTRRQAIPHGTVERGSAELLRGQRREVQAGRDGVRELTDEVVLVDGREESRSRVAERQISAPQDRVVEYGTRQPPPPAKPKPRDPPAPPPAAPPAPSNVEEGGASWYEHPKPGYTAAHRTLPMGTIVKVTNLRNGKSVVVEINDRGPFVDDRIIDLNREAFVEIARLGSGIVPVRIEW